MSLIDNSFLERRISVARQSGGISNGAIYDAVIAALHKGNAEGDCLDFGAGIGNLLRRISDFGFDSLTGADLYPRPESLNANWQTSDLNNSLPFSDESFDTVVSVETIEHLENPRAIAREWFRLLRPRGMLVLSTPNNESLRSIISLVMRGHFIAFNDSCYPAHITALTRKDISRILTEAGFSNIKFSFTHKGGLPKLPRFTWQQISLGLFRGLRFSDNVVVSARKFD